MGDEDRLPDHLRALFEEKPEKLANALEELHASSSTLRTGRMGRAFELSKLALKTGGRAVSARVRGGKDKNGLELATEMLKTFGKMRGLALKVGQMLSYLDDVMPPEGQRVLALLQRDAAPLPWEQMRSHLTREFGRPPEALFAEFEPEPVAAASIGQVHRAVLPNGTPVAVKVQYPGIDVAMQSDLKNAKFVSLFQRMMFLNVEMDALMGELEARFLDECDYRKEAEYQQAYRDRFAGHPYIVVPEVHQEWSTQRVLTTTFYEGKSFHEWLASRPPPKTRQRVTQLFYRFYLGSLYLDGLFNCDPHPGNYLFLDDGRVVFLDYGCCRRFSRQRLDQWIALNKAVYADDAKELHRLAIELGFFSEKVKYDREAFRQLMRYLYQPYLKDQPFDFAGEHRPNRTFRKMFSDNPNLFKLNMPADAVFLNRIEFGLVSLLAKIGGKLNCHRYATQYFRGIDPDWPEDPHRPAESAIDDSGS